MRLAPARLALVSVEPSTWAFVRSAPARLALVSVEELTLAL